MIDPAPTPSEPQPQPFAPEPQPLRPASGCGKPILAGCGVLALLVLILMALAVVKLPELLAWSLDLSRQAVAQRLPEQLEPGQRERLDAAFEAAVSAARQGAQRPEALPELQSVLFSLGGHGGELSEEEVRRLTRALERFAGIPLDPTEEPAQPAPPPVAGSPVAA